MKELALNHLPELAPRTVESLNLLRLRLEQTAPDAKIILLTSTTPQEGKTTLALQFWRCLPGLASAACWLTVTCAIPASAASAG